MSQHKSQHRRSILIYISPLIILLLALALTVIYLQRQTQTDSKATAATTLSFAPISKATSPLQKTLNTENNFDIMVTPGSNQISFIQLEINYDPTKFKETPGIPLFEQNTSVLPVTVEGPFYSPGKIAVSMSIGADRNVPLSTTTKIGTINLTAIATTDTPTQITFGAQTKVLSLGSSDQASENVLATATPATIEIVPLQTSTSPSSSSTKAAISLFLHGIGASGDVLNASSALSNKSPLHTQREVSVLLYDKENTLIKNALGVVTYQRSSGNFTGTIDLGSEIATGIYLIKIKTDQYLRKATSGVITITKDKTVIIPPLTLVGGDINNDNTLNILDYNTIFGCYSELGPATSCTPSQKLSADLNDDGNVNQIDYNFFLRELTVKNGD